MDAWPASPFFSILPGALGVPQIRYAREKKGDVMDARPLGALGRRKPVQRLIGMVMLLCCMIGLLAAPLLFNPASIAYADAQSMQIKAGGASSGQPYFGPSVYIFDP